MRKRIPIAVTAAAVGAAMFAAPALAGKANDTLYHTLRERHSDVHLLGDAYAPRRIWFATRQAYELAQVI